jgi:hypothetical protein
LGVEKESMKAKKIRLKQEERTCMVVGVLGGILKRQLTHEPFKEVYFLC